MIVKNKSFGQHFIYDKNLLRKIVKSAGDISKFNIIEIGGGAGTLTRAILNECPKSVISLEMDRRFISHHEKLRNEYINYNFIIGDALEFNLADLAKDPIVVIANLPYNISSILLFNWMKDINCIKSFILMFQKEVAKKLIAIPNTKEYGILSVLTQVKCNVEYVFTVSREAFSPPPKVESAVVRITPYQAPKYEYNDKNLLRLLKVGFASRRKVISNTLLPLFNSKSKLISVLEKIGVSASSRIEDVSVGDLCKLSQL